MAERKVVIVADWLVGGGAEKVVYELHKMFPDAPIHTSYCAEQWREKMDGKVVTGLLQNWPFSKLRKFLPILRIWYFGRLDLSEYDLVISSSGAEAKSVRKNPDAIHVSYIHAPTHYYWARYDEYLKNPGFGRLDPLARLGLKLLIGPLRRWDFKAAQRPDYLIANSGFTRDEIKKYYGREAVVIHPPVDVARFAGKSDEPRRGFITAGRQTPYKRIDLAVRACSQLGLPLIVIGQGPDHRRLKKLAGKSVTFLTKVDDEKLAHYFKTSQAFLFPGVDDFGIVAVEALAAGTPVIAYDKGGALDYVNKETGLLFDEPSSESLAKVLGSFKPDGYDHAKIAKTAKQFTPERFRTQLADFIEKL